MADEKKLLIANFDKGPVERFVKSTSGVTVQVQIGPQTLREATDAQVGGPLPWSIGPSANYPGALPINSLPAIAAYGHFPPSGAFNYGYLTGVIYSPSA